jgi:hypothetical protein
MDQNRTKSYSQQQQMQMQQQQQQQPHQFAQVRFTAVGEDSIGAWFC